MTNSKPRRLDRLRAALALSTALALAAGMLAASSVPAAALTDHPYRVEILVDGVPLDEIAARGTTYVEALAGREYAVRLTNNSSRRVAVALSVDGLNSIDAKSTPVRQAARWIVDPWSSVTIDGWQTGPDTARRFFFTTEERSYGAWLGETSNLGVISAAFFREKPRPVSKRIDRGRRESRDAAGRAGAAQRAPAAAPGEPGPAAGLESEALSDDMAATGNGREVDHRVTRIRFRAERDPASVLSLRYEYRDALVRLGVLPLPSPALDRRERARGFADAGFAPDPYRRRR